MLFAYADPPYLGRCSYYDHDHGDDGRCWDELDTHRLLAERLAEYDGWALSLSVPMLREYLVWLPTDVRILVWAKKWASWKPGQWPAYGWEPVLMRSPRSGSKERPTPRDWFASHVTTGTGFTGRKPETFVRWVVDCLGMEREDDFVDLFPGSGAVTEAYERWRAQLPLEIVA